MSQHPIIPSSIEALRDCMKIVKDFPDLNGKIFNIKWLANEMGAHFELTVIGYHISRISGHEQAFEVLHSIF